MNYTIQDYQNAQLINSDWVGDVYGLTDFGDYCSVKILELSSPALRKYQCISSENIAWAIVGKTYAANVAVAGFLVSELPFHFELITEQVTKEQYTKENFIADIDSLLKTGHRFSTAELFITLFRKFIETNNL